MRIVAGEAPGSAVGPPIGIATFASDAPFLTLIREARVIALPDGFFVAWQENSALKGARYNVDGVIVGEVFRFGTGDALGQLSLTADGRILVAVGNAGNEIALVILDPRENVIHGAELNDVITTQVGDTQIFGDAGSDVLLGQGGHDTFDGGRDRDTLKGGGGNDTFILKDVNLFGILPRLAMVYDEVVEFAGGGIDTVRVQQAAIGFGFDPISSYTLAANVENGIVDGTGGFSLTGNELANTLTGNGAANTLAGGAGADVLDGGLGADTLQGGIGDDRYILRDRAPVSYDSVIELAGEGTDTVLVQPTGGVIGTIFSSYTLGANVENGIIEGVGTFHLTGNELANSLTGNGAANTLDGAAGADVLTGGLGKDTMRGGGDADRFVFSRAGDTLVGVDRDVIRDWQSMDTVDIRAIDANFFPGNQDFVFRGLGSADRMVRPGEVKYYHFGDNTYVVGNTATAATATFQIEILGVHALTSDNFVGISSAILTGTGGTDVLRGTVGRDLLSGLGGDDVLIGKLGKDTMFGGSGGDTFRFGAASETALGANRDVIGDWDALDILDVSPIDANASVTGNQDFTFIGLDAANHTVGQGQIKYYQFGGNTYVVGNATADTTADFQIEITGAHTLTSANFIGLI